MFVDVEFVGVVDPAFLRASLSDRASRVSRSSTMCLDHLMRQYGYKPNKPEPRILVGTLTLFSPPTEK